MIDVDIPGYRRLRLDHLVLDYNGTLARDGEPVPGVRSGLLKLAQRIKIHVVTADTFGKVRDAMADVPCAVTVLPGGDQARGKLDFVHRLGSGRVAAGGNGRNDRLMLKEAALGIGVLLEEGAAVETLLAADVVFTDIRDALAFLDNPLRMTATLRS